MKERRDDTTLNSSEPLWFRLLRELWVAVAVGVFWSWYYDENFELSACFEYLRDEMLLALLIIISLPAGWVLGKALSLLTVVTQNQDWIFVTSWLSLFVVGYWQWFVLVPKIIGSRGKRIEEKKTQENK